MNVQWNFTRDRELLLVLDSVSRHLRSFEFIVPKNDPDVTLSDVLSLEKELLNYVEALKKVSVKDFGYAEKPEKFRLGIMRFKVLN